MIPIICELIETKPFHKFVFCMAICFFFLFNRQIGTVTILLMIHGLQKEKLLLTIISYDIVQNWILCLRASHAMSVVDRRWEAKKFISPGRFWILQVQIYNLFYLTSFTTICYYYWIPCFMALCSWISNYILFAVLYFLSPRKVFCYFDNKSYNFVIFFIEIVVKKKQN